MQDISFSLTAAVFLALIALLVAAVMVPAETVVTFQNVHAVPLSGRIVVIQETPNMNFTTAEVEKDSRLRFTRDSEGPLVIRAVVWGRSPTERVVEIYPESIETVREYRSKQRLANQVSSWLKKAMNRTIREREEATLATNPSD